MKRAAAALIALAGCAADDAAYYAGVERDMRAAGLMRTETAPADAAFGRAELVENFERIALFDEYVRADGRFVLGRTPSVLTRWEGPVRIRVVFGDTVPGDARGADLRDVGRFAGRLATLTRLDIRLLSPLSDEEGNFVMIFAARDERRRIADGFAAASPDVDPAFLNSLRDSPRAEVCYVNTFRDAARPGVQTFAVVVIKAETEGLMRRSCIEEEMTQALGLGNDDPAVRPSIFNDDEEFALLTRHDEVLLRMLYDPRLRPGMTAAEVRPLLPRIAARALAP